MQKPLGATACSSGLGHWRLGAVGPWGVLGLAAGSALLLLVVVWLLLWIRQNSIARPPVRVVLERPTQRRPVPSTPPAAPPSQQEEKPAQPSSPSSSGEQDGKPGGAQGKKPPANPNGSPGGSPSSGSEGRQPPGNPGGRPGNAPSSGTGGRPGEPGGAPGTPSPGGSDGKRPPPDQASPGGQGGEGFFGLRGRGNSFVYVIDCSASMEGARFGTAKAELLRSLAALTPDQKFSVIFYSNEPYIMFFPEEEDSLLPATAENVRRAREWIQETSTVGQSRLLPAVEKALQLEPDVIYVLTDGQLDERLPDLIARLNRGRAQIFTVGIGNRKGAAVLQQIARKNNGAFRFVPIR